MAIQITVNGKEFHVNNGYSVYDFLMEHSPQKEWVAVAINMNIISKESYKKTKFKEGDKVDIVRPVAGG